MNNRTDAYLAAWVAKADDITKIDGEIKAAAANLETLKAQMAKLCASATTDDDIPPIREVARKICVSVRELGALYGKQSAALSRISKFAPTLADEIAGAFSV